jgi:hypothetical protein
MSTKANPGKYDCYDRADPEEPIFVLRANDPLAPEIVREWARSYSKSCLDPKKFASALDCANQMEEWWLKRNS